MIRDLIRLPLRVAQLGTQAKSFEDNKLLAQLHPIRVKRAHLAAARRRRRLAVRVETARLEEFEDNGFVTIRNFLTPHVLAELSAQLGQLRTTCREKREGDTVMRKISISETVLNAAPAVATAIAQVGQTGLIDYIGARAETPVTYLQTIFQFPGVGDVDPQTRLHADTFHPTVKSWLFLTDVKADEGAFTYVPGSHRLSPQRLRWEAAMSMSASESADIETRQGSPRLCREQLGALKLPQPVQLAVPANTLVVADTFGFHCRGTSAVPSTRMEIWSIGRRCPFLFSPTLDRWIARATREPDPDEWERRADVGPLDPPLSR